MSSEKGRGDFTQRASGRLGRGLELATQAKSAHFARISGRLSYRGLEMLVSRGMEHVSTLGKRADTAFINQTTTTATKLDQYKRILESLSYKSVLSRGYAVIRNNKDAAISSAAQLGSGDAFSVEFSDGSVSAVAASAKEKTETKISTRSKKSPDAGQGDLF